MLKKIGLSILVLTIVFLIFSGRIFGQEEKDEALAIIHGPYVQNVTENSATIMWFTNKKCVSKIEYGTGDNFRTFPQWGSLLQTAVSSRHGLIDAFTTAHSITVSGLEPGKVHRYRVVSKEIAHFQPYEILYGSSVVSDIYSFRTLNPEAETVTFFVVNDIHENSERLDTLLQPVDWDKIDLVFLNGDSLNHIEEENQIFSGFLDTCVEWFAKEIPFVFIRGNHETRGKFARNLNRYVTTPENRFYFSFNHGPVHFIVLDTGEDKPDAHPVYAGLADFDAYRDQQAEWLNENIKSDGFKKAVFKIVLCHIPPFGGNDWHGEQYIRSVWGPLFNESKISLLVCAHTHRFNKLDADEHHNYPIVIGDTDTAIKITADKDQIEVLVTDADFQVIESFAILVKDSR
jgi:hypothetical protein